jgi:hypothetical protein
MLLLIYQKTSMLLNNGQPSFTQSETNNLVVHAGLSELQKLSLTDLLLPQMVQSALFYLQKTWSNATNQIWAAMEDGSEMLGLILSQPVLLPRIAFHIHLVTE